MRKDDIKNLIVLRQEAMPFEVIARDTSLPVDGGMIIAVPGIRRCGKSTRMELAINDLLARGVPKENILWIGFDDERFAMMKSGDLDLILEAYRELYPETALKDVWMFFDELPLVEGWELFVLRVYKHYCRNIFVCGSNAHTLSRDIKSELRGWPVEYETWPLSFAEFCDFRGLKRNSHSEREEAKLKVAFDEFNKFGGMPEIALTRDAGLRCKRLQGYFDTMLLKDFIEHFRVRNPLALRFFLKRAMANIANPLSVNALYGELKAQGFKIAKDELYVWLQNACDIYMFLRVPKFSRSLAKQETAQSKYYVADNGLRAATIPVQSDDNGRQLENTVYLELLRRKSAAESILYYQGKGGCDFVLCEDAEVKELIQVTWEMRGDGEGGERTRRREFAGLAEAAESLGCERLTVVTHDEEGIEAVGGHEVRVVPAWKWVLGRAGVVA